MTRMIAELERLAAARPEAARHAAGITGEGERQAMLTAIMADGHPRRPHLWRRHRLRFALAGAGAVALAAPLVVGLTGVTGAGPARNTGIGHPAPARLTAWTVTKLADGNISVTINQFKDPAGLQSTLRADGVAASVTFTDQRNPECRAYPGGTPGSGTAPAPHLLQQVFPQTYQNSAYLPPSQPGPAPSAPSANSVVIVIDPSALPGNSGVQLAGTDAAPHLTELRLPQVVYASTQCTGS